jgi:hypothetical protein
LRLIRLQSADGIGSKFFVRAKQNVRAKERAVNSFFLVQLRKMSTGAWRRFEHEKKLSSVSRPGAWWARIRLRRRTVKKMLLCGSAHLSTASAQEMQKEGDFSGVDFAVRAESRLRVAAMNPQRTSRRAPRALKRFFNVRDYRRAEALRHPGAQCKPRFLAR